MVSRKLVRPSQFAEQIAGDEKNIDVLLPTIVADTLDGLAQIEGAIDPPKAVAEVPVGGVQDTHGFMNDGGSAPGRQCRFVGEGPKPTR